ncbi:YuiA family protein [Paenalkalicoccus suaedae]|nr:YuiA family protein [Paenalkalicoccus suaedae]
MKYKRKRITHGQCSYCAGKGYHQLLLGGSETCEHCHGSGKSSS